MIDLFYSPPNLPAKVWGVIIPSFINNFLYNNINKLKIKVMKLNNSKNYESIKVFLSPIDTPIAYENKIQELVEQGMSLEEAKNFVGTIPIELEIYYSKNNGLFGVEAEAVESGTVYNPYTSELLEEADDDIESLPM